ncbi:MAG: hypothetical protein WDM90_14075 [Ferruginibacter sp.]
MKAILFDDEFAGIENLKGLLQNFCPEINIVATSQQSTDAKNLIEAYQPQLVFLDVSMPMLTALIFLSFFLNETLR